MRNFLLVLLLFQTMHLSARAPIFTEKDFVNHPPRIIRTCCAFGTDLKVSIVPGYRYTKLTNPGLLGPHHYLGDRTENNGIIYTRRGGFLDFGHLRDIIDWTAYLYNVEKKSMGTGEFLINLGFEAGNKSLAIKIPAAENEETLLILAGRMAYDLSIWHEITSWFGASAVPLVSEKFSSFSIEDAFSNLLGSKIAMEAIKSDLPFNEAVTELIHQTLMELEAVSTNEESWQAMEEVRDIWWTRKKRLPNNRVMLQRQLGAYDTLAPWLVTGWEARNPAPYNLSVPESTPDGVPLSAFYTFRVNRNNKVPVRKIFPDRNDRMITQADFSNIITYIAGRMDKTKILYKL